MNVFGRQSLLENLKYLGVDSHPYFDYYLIKEPPKYLEEAFRLFNLKEHFFAKGIWVPLSDIKFWVVRK